MSDNKAANSEKNSVKLNSLFLFKVGMSTVFENGQAIPVTVLRYEPWVVSQVKSTEKDGYNAVQLACSFKPAKSSNKSEVGHFKAAGFTAGARHVKEVRMEEAATCAVGDMLSIDSLEKGQNVNAVGVSKGKGFAGVVRRYKFAGGPASHGSKFHRQPGSSGNRTWPGRVMPGKKFPGHLGVKTTTLKNLTIVDVMPTEKVVLIKGSVPGAPNSLIQLVRN